MSQTTNGYHLDGQILVLWYLSYYIPLEHSLAWQGWDRKYLKKEEDNLVREQSDRVGGGCGRGASHGRAFWDFWYQKQLF